MNNGTFKLLNEDCLEALKRLESNYVDSLITDPPAGISFMGKSWDDDKGGRDAWIQWMESVMTEALRVLKPGSHGLVWALPRTSHWTATALEDAGFEIRDVVNHVFGTGFPKSLDISKAIDKAAGAVRIIEGYRHRETGELSDSPITDSGGAGIQFGMAHSHSGIRSVPVTAPATEAAKQWEGWGTALKPACEHWILVRKPLSEKTVAANVLKHGTGGINVDGGRIGVSEGSSKGRFPANLVLDEVAATALDEQSGTGGTSRFFYVAKASKSDKGADNTHPTVKSQALMSYLIKLITPPNGVVLDPFMGSGSTGVTSLNLGFGFIGIEKEEEYYTIAEHRITQGRGY